MEREELERLLTGDDGASLAASAALRGGASYLICATSRPPTRSPRSTAADSSTPVRKGIDTTGLEHAVQLLSQHDQSVRLGQIWAADGTCAFMLFLSQDGSEILACTGVRQPSSDV
ncbi:hypothetical protein GCM10009757_24190 [Streptomyces cheonanensis]|uniref:Uncharacterized protein n=1 Tax=Streptomyces cheonanensis TaxID=312720 RepID=A0ABP5GQY6_9ACTN